MTKIRHVFSLIKFSHTLFALPFALASMLVAAHGLPSLKVFLLILVCMVSARTAAMAFNRYLDADFDARNPRTANREIPRGIISRRFALLLSINSALVFVLAAGMINPLCMMLAPVAMFLLFFYSYTKRLTSLSHLVLGLTLAISPVGAWIAVTGQLALAPLLLGLAVLFWVAGFDIIYATQDFEFDKKEGLHSLVVRYGIPKALWISRLFHLTTLMLFCLFGYLADFGFPFGLALLIAGSLLVYEHWLVKPNDLSRVNAAFFNMNGYLSLVFLAGVILSIV